MATAKNPAIKRMYGIDIQQDMVEMARKSVQMNDLNEKIEILNEDIKGFSQGFLRNTCDVVITNPPYKKIETGIINKNEKKLISRHEIKCTLKDIVYESAKLLKDKGIFYMVHRPERLSEIFEVMKQNGIEPKEIQFVYPNINSTSNLILIKGVKGAKPYMKILKPLFVYDENNNYTEELLKCYSKGE